MFVRMENLKVADPVVGYCSDPSLLKSVGSTRTTVGMGLQMRLLGASTPNVCPEYAQKRLNAWKQAVDQAEVLVLEDGKLDFPGSADKVREALISLVMGKESGYYVAAFQIFTSGRCELNLYLARYAEREGRYYRVRFRNVPSEVLLRFTLQEDQPGTHYWDVQLPAKNDTPRVREYTGKTNGCRDWLYAALTGSYVPVRYYRDVRPLTPLEF